MISLCLTICINNVNKLETLNKLSRKLHCVAAKPQHNAISSEIMVMPKTTFQQATLGAMLMTVVQLGTAFQGIQAQGLESTLSPNTPTEITPTETPLWDTEEIPEEILQTEIILEARSPLDGQPLTPAEYAQLQTALSQAYEDVPTRLSPKVHRLIIVLRLRKVLSTFIPFLF